MYDGKLRWSKKPEGSWYTFCHDDENFYYIAYRQSGGWALGIGIRFMDKPKRLGLYIYLKDAKLAADIDHHRRIKECDNENLKDYIERYPITCPEPLSYSA